MIDEPVVGLRSNPAVVVPQDPVEATQAQHQPGPVQLGWHPEDPGCHGSCTPSCCLNLMMGTVVGRC